MVRIIQQRGEKQSASQKTREAVSYVSRRKFIFYLPQSHLNLKIRFLTSLEFNFDILGSSRSNLRSTFSSVSRCYNCEMKFLRNNNLGPSRIERVDALIRAIFISLQYINRYRSRRPTKRFLSKFVSIYDSILEFPTWEAPRKISR